MDATTAVLIGAALIGIWKHKGDKKPPPPRPPVTTVDREEAPEERTGYGMIGSSDYGEDLPANLAWLPGHIQRENPRLGEATTQSVAAAIARASQLGEVPASLLAAMIQVESNFNPAAKSPNGAAGLGQLMPFTAQEMGVADPYDPRDNALGAAKYLKKASRPYASDPEMWQFALASYRIGPGAVQRTTDREAVFEHPVVADYLNRVRAAQASMPAR